MACCTGSTPEEKIQPRELFLYYFMRKSGFMTDEGVKDACDTYPKKSLEIISTDEKDTVLHIASRLKKKNMVLQLLEIVPKNCDNRLANAKNCEDCLAHAKNKRGNNVLHEVVVSDSMKKVAEKMLDMAPSLLAGRNELGETPIFCAARYGQLEMFKLLERRQTGVDVNQCLKRGDGTTALHISIYTEYFELARHIAEGYPDLIAEKDPDSMTALQHLACNPTPFEKYKKKPRKESIQEMISKQHNSKILQFNQGRFNIKSSFEEMIRAIEEIFESIRSKWPSKRKPLGQLVKLLVKKDNSWEPTGVNSQEVEEENNDGNVPDKGQDDRKTSTGKKDDKSQVPALLLATISNIEVIVKETIKQHPEALGCTNKKGQNILHLAILHGNIDIFNMVIQAKIYMSRLSSAVDKKGNSILHMFGSKESSQSSEKMQSPAFQLQNELKLFKEVKSACKGHLTKRLNNDKQTAEELFAAKNENLHREAKEWLMRTTENCTILSVFIATVAFAAANTVPGGSDQNTGLPILCSEPRFVVFILFDVASLALALTSVGLFISILTSSFALQDFETILFRKLRWGLLAMIYSITMMAVAFEATIVLIWKDPNSAMIGSLPVPILILSYSPLRSAVIERYKSLSLGILKLVLFICYVVVLCLWIFLWYLRFFLRILSKVCRLNVCGNKSGAESGNQDLNQTPTDPAPHSAHV